MRSIKPRAFRSRNKYGARQTRGYASKLEADYASLLDARKAAGEIMDYLEQVPIKLPGKIKYVVDFAVIALDGTIAFVETKGRETDVYRLKMRLLQEARPEIYARLEVVS